MREARQEREQKHQVFEHRVDLAHIWVTIEGPPAGNPYQTLGDEANISARLKKIALDKWPHMIDAIVT